MRLRTILLDAADSAMAAGAAGTVLAMVLMLSSISDVSGIPRRTALALASLFFAYVAAEFVLVPLSRRLPCRSSVVQPQPHEPGGPKRQFHGLSSFVIVVFSIMTLMYALSAALA